MASGDPVSVLPRLWKEFGATHLTFEEDETLEPYALKRDKVVMIDLFQTSFTPSKDFMQLLEGNATYDGQINPVQSSTKRGTILQSGFPKQFCQ